MTQESSISKAKDVINRDPKVGGCIETTKDGWELYAAYTGGSRDVDVPEGWEIRHASHSGRGVVYRPKSFS